VSNKYSVNTEPTVTGIRCEIYKALHDLEWSLHNAPLNLIEDPKRILKKVEEALAICEDSHNKKRQESKNEDR
jgi:hypothetical protein